MTIRIKEVYVSNCCGTYCVYIEDITQRIKVAHIDTEKGVDAANKYAQKLGEFFKLSADKIKLL